MKNRIITFPWMGKQYTRMFKQMMENLGLEVQLPPKTTDKTIKLGVKNSASMYCYPLKSTLGNFIEALDYGANTLLMYDTSGPCKFRHYHKVQEYTLRRLGYDFEMYGLSKKNIFSTLAKLSGNSKLKVLSEIVKFYKNIKEHDYKKTIWSSEKPNIGIIGEIFTCIDETTNYGIENKIRKLGANPYNTLTISEFLNESIINKILPFRKDEKKKYKKEASKYLNGELGGHGYENLYNLLWLIDKKVDGVLHILPLTCSPEVAVETFINGICKDNNVPLLRINIDENDSELNLETRLETYIELIKMKEKK